MQDYGKKNFYDCYFWSRWLLPVDANKIISHEGKALRQMTQKQQAKNMAKF